MTGSGAEVSGDLVVQRPGARAVPVALSGSPRRVRLRVPSARQAMAMSPGLSLAELGARLSRWGVELIVETPRVRLVHLGGPSRPVRLSAAGAVYTLLTTPPWRVPSLIRAVAGARTDKAGAAERGDHRRGRGAGEARDV